MNYKLIETSDNSNQHEHYVNVFLEMIKEMTIHTIRTWTHTPPTKNHVRHFHYYTEIIYGP